MAKIHLLDLPIDDYTMEQALTFIENKLTSRKNATAEKHHLNLPLIQVVTINPEIAWKATQNADLREAINEADLVVPDGIGVVIAAKLKGFALPERVAGFDLMQHLLALAAEKGYRVYLLGAAPGVAQQAAAVACTKYPRLQIVGCSDGYFDAVREHELIQEIAQADVDLLFCALGPPRPAEQWIKRHKTVLSVGLAMGVGGSFNVMAGHEARAPIWMQRLGLEWLHRVIADPKRFGRLAAIPKFLWRVIWS